MSTLEDTLLLPSISTVPRMLIVDPDPAACAALIREVELTGYTASTVCSGEAALESLTVNFTPLVILDRRLPGVDGLEVCRRIRA